MRAPAKVNLHLGVGPLRPDGFHELSTVYQALSLADEVVASTDRGLTVEVEGDAEGVPGGLDNLAARAALAVADHLGRDPAVRLTIRKRIPVAAGLAGGSADAAAALLACAALWGAELDRNTLTDLAAGLGSDVPFALVGGTALGTGRGERVAPVLGRGRYAWVLVAAPGAGLSTPAVYAELDRLREQPGRVGLAARPDAVLAALLAGTPEALAQALDNDLQAAALSLRPALGETLDAGLAAGALAGVVSGSGPTVALLCADVDAADGVAAALADHPGARAVHVATAPAPGARVVEG